jgi:hypothetical protein
VLGLLRARSLRNSRNDARIAANASRGWYGTVPRTSLTRSRSRTLRTNVRTKRAALSATLALAAVLEGFTVAQFAAKVHTIPRDTER